MTTNRVDLSRPLIPCTIRSDRPLPIAAYPVIGELAQALDVAQRALAEILADEEPQP